MEDRTTPYKVGSTKQRIDEIVISDPKDLHLEMMSDAVAWMRVGDRVFWIEAKQGRQLYIREGEP